MFKNQIFVFNITASNDLPKVEIFPVDEIFCFLLILHNKTECPESLGLISTKFFVPVPPLSYSCVYNVGFFFCCFFVPMYSIDKIKHMCNFVTNNFRTLYSNYRQKKEQFEQKNVSLYVYNVTSFALLNEFYSGNILGIFLVFKKLFYYYK